MYVLVFVCDVLHGQVGNQRQPGDASGVLLVRRVPVEDRQTSAFGMSYLYESTLRT